MRALKDLGVVGGCSSLSTASPFGARASNLIADGGFEDPISFPFYENYGSRNPTEGNNPAWVKASIGSRLIYDHQT
jgi:hypothetical protein